MSKLGLLALMVTLAGLAFGLMVNAWVGTFEGTQYAVRFSRAGTFMTSGVAPAGWWLFAFMLGVAGGAQFRRLLPAMAVTIAVLLLALFGMVWLREDYAAPERIVAPATEPLAVPEGDALAVGTAWLDPTGRELSSEAVPICADQPSFMECLASSGYRAVTYLHEADQYWRFQWTEAGILAVGALLLGGVGYYRVAR